MAGGLQGWRGGRAGGAAGHFVTLHRQPSVSAHSAALDYPNSTELAPRRLKARAANCLRRLLPPQRPAAPRSAAATPQESLVC